MNITAKVRILNVFRNVFKIRFLESILSNNTIGKPSNHIICKLVPNPYQYKSGTFRIAMRKGIKMKTDIGDCMGHNIYYGFKDTSLETLFSLCKENFNIIDIGVNLGWTILNLAKISRTGKVIGFEPDEYNFERCTENLKLNNYDNIQVYQLGLGDRNHNANIEIRTSFNLGGNRIDPQKADLLNAVKIIRLDEFVPANQLSKIDLMKIDVEGYELKALKGAEQLIKKFKPVLFIELDNNNLNDQGDSACALITYLKTLGYGDIINAETNESVFPNTDFTNCHYDIIAR